MKHYMKNQQYQKKTGQLSQVTMEKINYTNFVEHEKEKMLLLCDETSTLSYFSKSFFGPFCKGVESPETKVSIQTFYLRVFQYPENIKLNSFKIMKVRRYSQFDVMSCLVSGRFEFNFNLRSTR